MPCCGCPPARREGWTTSGGGGEGGGGELVAEVGVGEGWCGVEKVVEG